MGTLKMRDMKLRDMNKYVACVGDVVNIDVIFRKIADSCRLKCVG